jgi:glycosyltransferase involved in cell wall biosynthesis
LTRRHSVAFDSDKKILNVYYHSDVKTDVDSTAIFVRRLCQELAEYFRVNLFVYSDVAHPLAQSTADYELWRIPRPRIPMVAKMRVAPRFMRAYNAVIALSPRLYLFSRIVSNPDYVLCVDSYSGFATGLLARLGGKRLVFRPNDCVLSFGWQAVRFQSRIFGALMIAYAIFFESLLTRLANLVLAPSRKTMLAFRKYYGLQENIFVCHTGSEARITGRSRAAIREELGIDPDKRVLLYLGIGDHAMAALPIEYIQKTVAPFLAREIPEAMIMVVGRGMERFRNSVSAGNLVIVGGVPEIGPYLEAADLGIAPLIVMGGQSSKTIDYLCAGLPVVATRSAAETLEPQIGLFASDIQDFHICVARVLRRVGLDKIRPKIREEALRHYSWEAIGVEVAKRIASLDTYYGT